MSRTFLIALCLGLVAICGGRARADLVVNGGFETESPAGCQIPPSMTPCNSPPSGWTISGDGVSIDATFPNTGNYDIAFATPSTDTNVGMLSQSITTDPSQSYTLTFFVADEAGPIPTDTLTVSYGGFTQTITGDEAPFSYTEETFTVQGDGTQNLVFEGINDNAAWNLDDVSFTPIAAVPAPVIGSGLPAFLAVGGILFGARFLQRSRNRRSPAIARPV
jgi:hypothetical protein